MNAKFYGDLQMKYVDGNSWEIANSPDPFGAAVDGFGISPPVGFRTDLLSIPWIARRIIPKTGGGDGSGMAAVIHDYLYSYPGVDRTPKNRKWADDVFRACLRALPKVKRWKCNFMYWAVRAGGWAVYGKPDKLNQ